MTVIAGAVDASFAAFGIDDVLLAGGGDPVPVLRRAVGSELRCSRQLWPLKQLNPAARPCLERL